MKVCVSFGFGRICTTRKKVGHTTNSCASDKCGIVLCKTRALDLIDMSRQIRCA